MACNSGKGSCGCDTAADAKAPAAEGPSDLLYKRMDALGVSTNDIERFAGGMTQELEKSCASCQDKGECRDDLAADPTDPSWNSYCPNSNALNAFKRLRGRFPI